MTIYARSSWREKLTDPERVLDKIAPGMNIYLGTGVAEPRTLVKHILASDKPNLDDLTLIQLISLGEAISVDERYYQKYRLKTFFAGWVASEAITAGRVDLIPCRFSRVPELIASGSMQVDVAFVQIAPPDENGYASLGVAVDAARQAIERASLVVGEINENVPRTLGDTFVHVDEMDWLVKSTEPPIYLLRWPLDPVFDKVAENVASIIEDGSCVAFTYGPLFEGLGRHLARKKHLGVHSLFFTDALMDLVLSGAVSNRHKGVFRGTSLSSYAFGTKELMAWLNRNPLVEFQGIEVVNDPRSIGRNDRFMAVLPARKVDLTGNVAMPTGKGNVSASIGAAQEVFAGAAFSRGGKTIFALPSRNLKGQPNILLSLADHPNQLSVSETLDCVVTEYGVAHLPGRTVRERSLALIDIAHPDDRAALVEQAKKARILYQDQIYLTESGRLYPAQLATVHTFKNGLKVYFRAIKPSDEEEMRRLFYRFSSEAVYYRYFSPVKAMPHARMQEYVNVDYRKIMSIVGLIGEAGSGRIVAEARYVQSPDRPYADTAYVVDEEYHGLGLATFLMKQLIRVAQERGIQGISADVLPTNTAMWKVLEKAPYPLKAVREPDYYHVTIAFSEGKKKG
ncbi:MAG: GNAT family N-acetyltransferase [Thermodesulfobacteriota bacterium]